MKCPDFHFLWLSLSVRKLSSARLSHVLATSELGFAVLQCSSIKLLPGHSQYKIKIPAKLWSSPIKVTYPQVKLTK